MSAPSDLATLDEVRRWIAPATTDGDAQLTALITSTSRTILGLLGRPIILPHTCVARHDGRVGLRTILLREWPVISVQSVTVGTQVLSAVDPSVPSFGYSIDPDPYDGAPPGAPQTLNLFGTAGGAAGASGILVNYTAGYQETQALVVPNGGGTVTVIPSYGSIKTDRGVTYASGGALVAVSGAPSAGQYKFDPTTGVYTFAAADQGKAVLASFGYVPADLAQACIETVALRQKASSQIGVKSKSLAGQEMVSFDKSAIPDAVMKMLQPYRRVTMS